MTTEALAQLLKEQPALYKAIMAQVACEKSLYKFTETMWEFVEPANKFVGNWHIEAICLPYDSMIFTEYGQAPIGEIVEYGLNVKVASYNHEAGIVEFRPILNRMKNRGQPLCDIILSDGTVMTLTGNHPVYIEGSGYVDARNVKVGSCVKKMRELQNEVSSYRYAEDGAILQPLVLPESSQCAGEKEKQAIMHGMQKEILSGAVKVQRVLQPSMHGDIEGGEGESGLHRREMSGAIRCGIQGGEEDCSEAGQAKMLSLQEIREIGYTPYQPRQGGECGVESSVAVQVMPQSSEGEPTGNLADGKCYVVEVKQSLRIPETVYNIEVEDNNNYFAQGVLVHNCEHLEAVTNGEITRLLMNVPPGTMKSLLTDVFWPAWEWINMPHMRYICTSYSAGLTERDNIRFRQVITADLYRAMWGDRFGFSRDSFNVTKIGNDKTGWKIATSTEGMGTGERGNRVIVDDPHNVKDGESEAVRKSTLQYFSEVLPTRVTDPISSAIVVIMQRVHEEDVSGYILSRDLGYTHLMLPMEYEPDRKCYVFLPNKSGEDDPPFFEDPRTEAGELLFPARMPGWVVERDKKILGPYASAGQFQQAPVPRGGGIIKREYWKLWPENAEDIAIANPKLEYPVMDYIIASADTAYSAKTEADYNALAILGLWRKAGLPKIMLMHCWKKRLDFRGEILPRLPDETDKEYQRRRKLGWGMLEWTSYECQRWGVDKLLIEAKATGKTLAQEVRKVYSDSQWGVQEMNPRGDKVARVYAIQHIFAEGMVYAPERAWAEEAITEMQYFPKGAHDDITDAITQGIRHLRDSGWALRREEVKAEDNARTKYKSRLPPLYDV